ncbi:hypothetical protein HIM_01738 [Hirsutella minnesotensis 3608]|nr:hypothetical protein HIM_01738 [Hirsutella minnesotensis 3608]
MSLDRRKWRSSSALALVNLLHGSQDESEKNLVPEAAESKAPRSLTKALRSLSSSSMDSTPAAPTRRSSSTRRLQKTPSNPGSMIGRIHRRVSNATTGSSSESPSSPAVDGQQSYSSMEVVHYGPLKADVSLLKTRAEYLVLLDQCLVKFTSVEAARSAFPQLTQVSGQAREASAYRNPPGKAASGDVRLEIPLHAIVAAFDEDGLHHRSGIEIWWFSQWPRLGYCKAHLHFALPRERDGWLVSIHRAWRARQRKTSGLSHVPDNLKARINHIVRANEGLVDEIPQNLIFPVARRVFGLSPKSSTADEGYDSNDSSSFYFVIGPCMCHFVEVLKADYSTLPRDLRVKSTSYGTVTLTRFKASVASHEQRFIMCFRSPFGLESRLDLASVQYRRIIEALTKADRILKPMWPQHFQQVIFDIKGLPPPLQLTSGNDLGGLRRSLRAYCAAYHVSVPEWKIEWNNVPQPAFRLLPPKGEAYTSLQLLAVFRALRYNSFFKAISFRDIDLSPLAKNHDYTQYGDVVAYRSLNGLSILEDHHEVLLQASILEQEIHAITFASESIRYIDLENVLGLQGSTRRQSRLKCDFGSLRAMSSELLRPILMLWRQQLSVCHSVSLSGNPLDPADVDELANLLMSGHMHLKKLALAKCALADAELSKLWMALPEQSLSLEWLDISDNHGTVRFDVVQNTLKQMKRITRLNISGVTRITSHESLLDRSAMNFWELQEVDLSGIHLNDATVDVLAEYLCTEQSQGLGVMRLNNCGLTGKQIARLFQGMSQARRITVYLNANHLEEGIDDFCSVIARGTCPWSLYLQMVEFTSETKYVKLLRALTVNQTIQCLSLAGTALADAASSTACQAMARFFTKNNAVRFLDISGYDSKLDEGRLGKGFSAALIGIKANTRIEHLRVRSQMLNVNIGDLAEAISANKTLYTLDCEGNDFNLSNFRHLINHLEENSAIRRFSAFTSQELSNTIAKTVQNAGTANPARRTSVMSKFRHDKSQAGPAKSLAQQLKDEWDGAVAELQRVLRRNQDIFEDKENSYSEFVTGRSNKRDSDADHELSTVFGGLAQTEFESRRAKSSQGPASPQRKRLPQLTICAANGEMEGETMRPISPPSSDNAISPSTDGGSSADAPSPPELEIPSERAYGLTCSDSSVRVVDEARDAIYASSDAYESEGLQMKRYRRFFSTTTSCIEEEEGIVETEKPTPRRKGR